MICNCLPLFELISPLPYLLKSFNLFALLRKTSYKVNKKCIQINPLIKNSGYLMNIDIKAGFKGWSNNIQRVLASHGTKQYSISGTLHGPMSSIQSQKEFQSTDGCSLPLKV